MVDPVRFLPLTPERWGDAAPLFQQMGASKGCWCMFWRTSRAAFNRDWGDGNRRSLRSLVEAGEVPGLLGYAGGQAVAWCSVAPRETHASLERSPTLRRIDDQAAWSVVCFFVSKPYRRQGLMTRALEAAAQHARARGSRILEGYPLRRPPGQLKGYEGFMGLRSAYLRAGFLEVKAEAGSHCVMRRSLE